MRFVIVVDSFEDDSFLSDNTIKKIYKESISSINNQLQKNNDISGKFNILLPDNYEAPFTWEVTWEINKAPTLKEQTEYYNLKAKIKAIESQEEKEKEFSKLVSYIKKLSCPLCVATLKFGDNFNKKDKK